MRSPSRPHASKNLLGRARELDLLAGMVERLEVGTGGAKTVVGEAGSGKSTLLGTIGSRAGRVGVQVVRLSGVESQPALPWAAVAEVCLPFEHLLDRVGTVRAQALRGALALEAASAPIDGLAVALGMLGLLAEAGAERPVLVLVDDLQWVDAESRAVLGFLGRRLGDDPVALIAASRTPNAVVGEEIALERLDDASLREVLAEAGVRSPIAQAAIVELAEGNPLLARRLAAGLDADERAGSRPLPATLRVPEEVADLYRAPLAELDDAARRALAVVAADTTGELATVLGALDASGLGLSELERVEELGLVEVGSSSVAFVHPIARTAAYQSLPAPLRRSAHAALAEAVGPGSPSGVLHRSAAAVGPDPALAADVADLGRRSLRRGAPLTAASQWIEAAALTAEGTDAADRLVAAARAALAAGEVSWAAELVAKAGSFDAERVERLDARLVDVRRAVAEGDLVGARRVAEAAADAHAASDAPGVVELLIEAARPMLVAASTEAPELIEQMWALAEDLDHPIGLRARILHGCGRFLQGDAEGAARFVGTWPALLEAEGPVAAGPFLAETAVLYYGYANQVPEALAILDAVEPAIRSSCATGALVPVLCARSFLVYGSDLRGCVEAGRDAVALSQETGQVGLTAVAEQTLVIAAANVGDEALTTQVADLLLTRGDEASEVWARAALGRLMLVQDRPEAAVEQFALLRDRIGPVNRSFAQFEADEAEALVRAGRVDAARSLLPALEADAAARGAWSRGQLRRIQALLAPDIDDASVHFAAARDEFASTDNKVALGIAELTWGEWLRRAKRRAEARRHLERALEVFGLAGAVGLRRRAEEELAAAGGSVDRTRPADELLNPTELHVARLASAGLTNRDIAGQLFISPRTVENHLGAVYRKLGVANRAALASRAATDPVLRPVASS